MYNSYISSGLFTIRTNGSLPLSFSECSNIPFGIFERNPLLASRGGCCCSSSCCSCCGGLNANPSLLYGLSWSSLIQWSPSRRLVLGGRDRYYCRVLGYGIDRCDYEVSCSVRGRNGGGRFERKGKGRFEHVNSRGRRWFSRVDDVDAVTDLLSEEISGECLGDGGRKRGSSNRVEMEKMEEKRESYGGEFRCGRRRNVRLVELESDSKDELASVNLKKEKCGRKEERDKREETKEYRDRWGRDKDKALLRGEKRMGRKASSSFSSYYSLASSGEFGSDKEADEERVDFLEGSSSRYREEVKSETGRYNGRVDKEIMSHRGSIEGEKKILEQRENAARTDVEWDLRKKTEKKLNEIEETQFKKEHVESHSRILRAQNSDLREASSSYQQINDEEEISRSAVDLDKRTRKTFSEVAIGVSEQAAYRRNYHQVTNADEVHGRNTEVTAREENMFSDREEKQSLDEELIWQRRYSRYKLDEEIAGEHNLIKKGQHSIEISEIGDVDAGDSRQQRLCGSRLKIQEEDGGARKARDANRLHYERAEQLSGPIDSRSSKKLSTLLSDDNGQRDKTIISQSGTSAKHQEGIVSIASGSSTDAKACRPNRDQINLQMVQLSQESQDVTNISLNGTNVTVVIAETATDLEGTAERRDQDRNSSAGVNPIQENTEDISTDENLSKSRNKSGNSSDLLAYNEKTSQGTLGTESISDVSDEEAYGTERKSKNYMNPSVLVPSEDALSSARRSDEVSLQFVGEFVEKARHELSTSKIIEEKMPSDRKSTSESESHKRKIRDKSSLASGVKGPSDEIWDLQDPCIQKSPEIEEREEGAGSDNVVVRRTGKSLWSTIANAFRLRWNSHTETSTSAKKSAGKSSSNESVSSETWFSGNEPDENSDENVKSERSRSRSHKATSSNYKLKRRQSSPGSQGYVSDSRRQLKSDSSLPLVSTKSGSTSAVYTSPSDVEKLSHGPESDVVESGAEIGTSSQMSLPTIAMSGYIGEKNIVTGEIAVSSSVLVPETEQPVISKPTDELLAPHGDDGNLKQKKLQRSKQVLSDRFDAWEEAYVIESEQRKMDELFMREALLEAKKAGDTWEVPVGAVLVQHGNIISRGHNLVEELRDSTAHAEMICIREASNQLRSWRLADTTLYVTLEPCPMCAGAVFQARINTLVWGAPNKLLGADGSWIRLFNGGSESESTDKPTAPVHPFHPNITIRRGILASECADVMQQFFRLRRRKREKIERDEEQPPEPSYLPIANRQLKVLSKMHGIFHAMHFM